MWYLSKINYIKDEFITVFIYNIFIFFSYFYLAYFSPFLITWLSQVAVSLFVLILLIMILFKRGYIKRTFLCLPVIIILGMFHSLSIDDYVGSYAEFLVRKNEFDSQVKVSKQNKEIISELRWPAWYSNAASMRDFVYSENVLPNVSPQEIGMGDCKRININLNKHYYAVFFVSCSGPLF
jgi:hypothetical protein